MKKAAFIFMGSMALFACNREECHECHYEDANNEEVSLGVKCDEELEEAEKNGHTVDSTTYEVHCEDH